MWSWAFIPEKKNLCLHKNLCTDVYRASFIIAKKTHNSPDILQQVSKLLYIHTGNKYYLAIKETNHWYIEQFRQVSKELCWVIKTNPSYILYDFINTKHVWNDKIFKLENKLVVTEIREEQRKRNMSGFKRGTGVLTMELFKIMTGGRCTNIYVIKLYGIYTHTQITKAETIWIRSDW